MSIQRGLSIFCRRLRTGSKQTPSYTRQLRLYDGWNCCDCSDSHHVYAPSGGMTMAAPLRRPLKPSTLIPLPVDS